MKLCLHQWRLQAPSQQSQLTVEQFHWWGCAAAQGGRTEDFNFTISYSTVRINTNHHQQYNNNVRTQLQLLEDLYSLQIIVLTVF